MNKQGMRDGFIIIKVNGTEVKSVDELNNLLARSATRISLEGFYPGYDGTYTYPIELK
jgi:S1-C subfamily serine protease